MLVELADPPDVIVCDAVRRLFPPRFDSSNALSVS